MKVSLVFPLRIFPVSLDSTSFALVAALVAATVASLALPVAVSALAALALALSVASLARAICASVLVLVELTRASTLAFAPFTAESTLELAFVISVFRLLIAAFVSDSLLASAAMRDCSCLLLLDSSSVQEPKVVSRCCSAAFRALSLCLRDSSAASISLTCY